GGSYPLVSRNQTWSFPFQGNKRRLLFAHQGYIGSYNATVLLLAGNTGAGDCVDRIRESENLLEYGQPFPAGVVPGKALAGPHRPPVWISVVGHNGLLPLEARLPAKGDDEASYAAYVRGVLGQSFEGLETPSTTPVPALWVLLVAAVSLVGGYLCV